MLVKKLSAWDECRACKSPLELGRTLEWLDGQTDSQMDILTPWAPVAVVLSEPKEKCCWITTLILTLIWRLLVK